MTKSAQDPVSAAQAVRDTDFPSAVRTKTGEALKNMLEQFGVTDLPEVGMVRKILFSRYMSKTFYQFSTIVGQLTDEY